MPDAAGDDANATAWRGVTLAGLTACGGAGDDDDDQAGCVLLDTPRVQPIG